MCIARRVFLAITVLSAVATVYSAIFVSLYAAVPLIFTTIFAGWLYTRVVCPKSSAGSKLREVAYMIALAVLLGGAVAFTAEDNRCVEMVENASLATLGGFIIIVATVLGVYMINFVAHTFNLVHVVGTVNAPMPILAGALVVYATVFIGWTDYVDTTGGTCVFRLSCDRGPAAVQVVCSIFKFLLGL